MTFFLRKNRYFLKKNKTFFVVFFSMYCTATDTEHKIFLKKSVKIFASC